MMKLQRISANEFKKNIGDTYAAANRGPVLIIKAHAGRGPYQEPIGTHVLMSLAHYEAMLAAAPTPPAKEPG